MQVKRNLFSATAENKIRRNGIKKKEKKKTDSQNSVPRLLLCVCEASREKKHHLSPKCVRQQKQLKPAAVFRRHYPQNADMNGNHNLDAQ